MTSRGWWCLVLFVLMLLLGTLRDVSLLSVAGLALLLWFAWEWLFFTIRLRWLWSKLRVARQVCDERGPTTTLWQGRSYSVDVVVWLDDQGRFPFAAIADPVPFGVRHDGGLTSTSGEIRQSQALEITYQIRCPLPGAARFEGVRVEISDLQGFFSFVGFLRVTETWSILPGVLIHRLHGASSKRQNELMPPGIHRLKQPGSGSELLDLRDYVPGDPPRTIAWKVSARRDRLITKEFESEVPIRCTLFLDVSSSVRLPSPVWSRDHPDDALYYKPLDRMIELTAAVIRSGSNLRDLIGLCLFDEQTVKLVRPERGSNHLTRLMRLLSDAASRGPIASRADAEVMLPIAYAFAQEAYPDLLNSEVNAMPTWLTWLVGIPRYTRHRRGWISRLNRTKRTTLLWGTTLIPVSILLLNVAAAWVSDVPDAVRSGLLWLLTVGVPLLVAGTWLIFIFSLLVAGKQRRFARWRKRLAALFCVRAGSNLPLVGGIELLLEDDDVFSEHLQRFLAEHHVPCPVPLYDEQGNYLFALPSKIEVLRNALLQAISRGRDNELFVLIIDLLELDRYLEPLLQAVRVALGRHHQVLLVCPWPGDVPLPGTISPANEDRPAKQASKRLLSLNQVRLHSSYYRIRRAFTRLGVQVICAENEVSLPLILERIDRIRAARIAAGGWS